MKRFRMRRRRDCRPISEIFLPNNTETLTFHHLLDLVIHFTSQLLRSLDKNLVASSHLTLGMNPGMNCWPENGCE